MLRAMPDRSRHLLRSGCGGQVSVILLVAACLAVVLLILALEAVRRHGLYWYDTGQDYAYGFQDDQALTFVVDLGETGFAFPSTTAHWDTALLELRVDATVGGYWFEPCIEVVADGTIDSQCYERGARGKRYLLLHAGAVRADRPVALRGRHLRWQSEPGTLRLFENATLTTGPLLVLAPHPDDAEIAAFGLYSSRPSFVVTMTAGNYVDGLYAKLSLSEPSQDELRGDVRTWDSLTVPSWGGVSGERTVNLGYLTHSLARFYDDAHADRRQAGYGTDPLGRYRQGALASLLESRGATGDWQSVVADLATAVRLIRPELIVAPHPVLDAHPDHQYTTLALLQALAELDERGATLLLYTNHHPQSESFPFGPSQSLVTLPPWQDHALPVARVNSFTLTDDVQLRKLFALEAMHDLRAPPLRLTGGPGAVLVDRFGQAVDLIMRDPFGDYSYYRRAVRPNELFFAYAPRDRPALEHYLAGLFATRRRPDPTLVAPLDVDAIQQSNVSAAPWP